MTTALRTDEIRDLPAAVPLVEAGRALGFGRTKAHELARAGEFPVPVLRLAGRYRVRRTDLLHYLGIDEEPEPGAGRR